MQAIGRAILQGKQGACLVSVLRTKTPEPVFQQCVLMSRLSITQIPNQWNNISCQKLEQKDVNCRYYSKKAKKEKKDKKDKSKKGGKHKMELSPEELNQVIDFDKMCHQMDLATEHLIEDYKNQLTLRTTAGVFDNLMVETSDGKFPLIQIAQIAQKNPQLIAINMTSMPMYIPAVKDAISNAGMNLNPQQDGTSLFVPLPKVTREHRETLAKNAKMLCDKTKDKVRDIQHRFLRDLRKHKDESEDLVFNLQQKIQETGHDYAEKAEEIMHNKQKELIGK